MTESIFLFTFLVAVIATSCGVIVLSFQQLRKVQRSTDIAQRMRKLRRPVQPNVTVLLYTYNNENDIEASLKSLMRSRYHSFDIVVIDGGSTDQTIDRFDKFLKHKRRVSIVLLRRRTSGASLRAFQAGYRKSQHGELVIPLVAPSVVDPDFIKRAVASRREKPQWSVELKDTAQATSLFGISKLLERTLWQQPPKIQLTTARVMMKSKKQPKKIHWHTATMIVQIVGFCALVVTGFIVQNFILLWYAWIIITAYSLVAIWLASYRTMHEKITLSFASPTTFILLPVTSFIEGISQFSKRK